MCNTCGDENHVEEVEAKNEGCMCEGGVCHCDPVKNEEKEAEEVSEVVISEEENNIAE